MKGRRCKLWLSRNGVGGVGAMVKEMCEKVVEERRVSDGVMTVVVVLEEDVLMLICGYAPQKEEVWKKNSLFVTS